MISGVSDPSFALSPEDSAVHLTYCNYLHMISGVSDPSLALSPEDSAVHLTAHSYVHHAP
jgi:hypothetical protein